MGLRSFFRSRWVKIPLLLVVLLVLAAGGYLVYQLGTTTPGMYSTLGVAQPASASTLDEGSETLVYTSLRPSNWDVYLFDSLNRIKAVTGHPTPKRGAPLKVNQHLGVKHVANTTFSARILGLQEIPPTLVMNLASEYYYCKPA